MKRWLSGLLAMAVVWGPVPVDADEEKAEKLEGFPLGYEVKVKGTRRTDGTVLAREVDAEPNGSALSGARRRRAGGELNYER